MVYCIHHVYCYPSVHELLSICCFVPLHLTLENILKHVEAESKEKNLQEIHINLVFKNIIKLADEQPTYKTSGRKIEDAIKELKKKKCKDAEGWVNELLIVGNEEMYKSLKNLTEQNVIINNKMEFKDIS